MLLTEIDYLHFLNQVKEQDNKLYELSKKFADITSEAKKILDSLRDKSESRKKAFGIDEDKGEYEKVITHHKSLPRELKEKLLSAITECGTLHLSFDKLTLQTQSATLTLHESLERIQKLRRQASLSGADEEPNSLEGTSHTSNLFNKFQEKAADVKEGYHVYGSRGKGIYQDSVLKKINEKVQTRTIALENVIKARLANEQYVSYLLMILSVGGIIALWIKIQLVLSSKGNMSFGAIQGGSQSAVNNNYMI